MWSKHRREKGWTEQQGKFCLYSCTVSCYGHLRTAASKILSIARTLWFYRQRCLYRVGELKTLWQADIAFKRRRKSIPTLICSGGTFGEHSVLSSMKAVLRQPWNIKIGTYCFCNCNEKFLEEPVFLKMFQCIWWCMQELNIQFIGEETSWRLAICNTEMEMGSYWYWLQKVYCNDGRWIRLGQIVFSDGLWALESETRAFVGESIG